MTLDEFWEHIRKSKRKDLDARAERLIERLSKLSPDEIIDFEYWWNTMHTEAHTWDLWDAASLINDGCSHDSFIDFRSWLILQGRDVFQAAVTNPDTLADVNVEKDEASCECYPASAAWFAATGMDVECYAALLAVHQALQEADKMKPRDLGEQWARGDNDQLRKRLPRLTAKFIDGDDE